MFCLSVLLVAVLALLWVVMAAPIGRVTLRSRVTITADAERVWSALDPFGENHNWNGAVVSVIPDTAVSGTQVTRHESRDGTPIQRRFALTDLEPGRRYTMRYTDDSSLASNFWANYSCRVIMDRLDSEQTRVQIAETDRYRGIAFAVYRFFALRRLTSKLKRWAETGEFRKGGVFEHPLTQCAMAGLSALLLWPLFGLDLQGFVMAAVLTAVVALHELGHMAAFRLMGHRSARMIFLPLLGGIAMGGRPYHSHFEVAFAALMGPGLSVFALVIAFALAASGVLASSPVWFVAVFFVLVCGFFNLANLLPVWKFDGGQVLRQVFRNPIQQALAAASLLAFFIFVAMLAGLSLVQSAGVASVVLCVSLVTGRNGVKPKRPLVAMSAGERAWITAGLAAVCITHAMGALWAWQQLAI